MPIKKQLQNQFDELPLTYRTMPNFWGRFQDLTLLDIQAKGSHNSFEQTQDIGQQLQVNSVEPFKGGCINIELDIFPKFKEESDKEENPSNMEFFVKHLKSDVQIAEQEQNLLSYKLKQINEWHENQIQQVNQNKIMYQQQQLQTFLQYQANFQQPIQLYETFMYPTIISIDIKSSNIYHKENSKNVQIIDDYIKSIIPIDKIYTPKDMLMQNLGIFKDKTLIEIVQKLGYPKLKELMGKYIIIITGKNLDKKSNNIKKQYSKNPIDRLGFVDIDSRIFYNNDGELQLKLQEKLQKKNYNYEDMIYNDLKSYVEKNPNNIFFNQKLVLDDNVDNFNTIERILHNLQQAKELKLFVRGWFVNTKLEWDIFKAFNINILTTDNIFYSCWTILNDDYLNQNCQSKYIVTEDKSYT